MTALDRLKRQKTTTNYESAAAGGGTRGSYTAMDRLWSAPTVQTQRATREEWEDFGDRIDRGVTLLTRPDTNGYSSVADLNRSSNGAGTPVLSDWLSESASAAVRAAAPGNIKKARSLMAAAGEDWNAVPALRNLTFNPEPPQAAPAPASSTAARKIYEDAGGDWDAVPALRNLGVPAPAPAAPRASGFSTGRLVAGMAEKGLAQTASGIANTMELAERATVGNLFPGSVDDSPIHALAEYYRANARRAAERYAENTAAGGRAAEIADELGTATVAALPNSLLALLSAGGSVAPNLTAQAVTLAGQAAPGIMSALRGSLASLAQNPGFWSSMAQTAGNSYQSALAEGADEHHAQIYGLANGILNAAIEVGGGLETLPGKLREESGPLWRQLLSSSLDEAKEEVQQGIVERGLQGIYGKHNDLLSTNRDSESAVLNPWTMAREAFGGFAVGMILGGGQAAFSGAVGAQQSRAAYEATGTALIQRGGAEAEVRKGLLFPADSTAHLMAERLSDGQASPREIGELAIRNAEALSDYLKNLDTTGDDAAKAAAGAILLQSREDGTVTPDQLRAVLSLQTRQETEDATLRDIRRRAGLIGPDGSPLPLFSDFQQEYRSYFPDAEPEEVRQEYQRFLADASTISFDGQPLNFDAFLSAVDRESGGQVSQEDAARVFEYLQGQQLRDGLDAKERADAQRQQPPVQGRQDAALPAQTGQEVALPGAAEALPGTEAAETGEKTAPEAPRNGAETDTSREDSAPEREAFQPGLVRDEYTERELDRGEAARLDAAARLLGLRVELVDSVAGGEASAEIAGDTVRIERYNDNPLGYLFGHELTHALETAAPEQHNQFLAAIRETEDFREDLAAMGRHYESRGEQISQADLDREAAANYAGRLLQDGAALDSFIERNSGRRSLLRRVRDAVSSLIERLRSRFSGQRSTPLDPALGKLNAALDAAADTVRETGADREADGQPARAASRKGTEATREIAELRRENARLQARTEELAEQRDRWKRETQLTRKPTVLLGDAKKLTSAMLQDYSSDIKEADLRPGVIALANEAMQGPEATGGSASAWMEDMRGRARDIAARIIQSSRELQNADELETIREIKKTLRETPLRYGEIADQITDFHDFRRRNMGRLRLAKERGTAVDVLYNDLRERFGPAYFPADLTAPADQLEHLADLAASLGPVYDNPYSADLTVAIEYCANDLLERAYALAPDTTAADRQRAAYEARLTESREAYRQKALAAVQRERERGAQRIRKYQDRQADIQRRRIERRNETEVRGQLRRLAERLGKKRYGDAYADLLGAMLPDVNAAARAALENAQALEGLEHTELRQAIREGHRRETELALPPDVAGVIAAVIRENPDTLNWTSDHFNPGALLDLIREHRERNGGEWHPQDLRALSQSQMEDVITVLRAFEHAVTEQDRLIGQEERGRISEIARGAIRDIRESTRFSGPGWVRKLKGNMLSPLRWARRVTGYVRDDGLVQAMADLQKGADTERTYDRRAYDFVSRRLTELGYNQKRQEQLYSQLSGRKAELVTVGFYDAATPFGPDGQIDPGSLRDVQITKGMRVALYLLSQNADARLHMMEGGITVPSNWDAYRRGDYADAYAEDAARFRLDANAIRQITAGMTKEELDFARVVHDYYDTMSKQELSAVAEALQGYSPYNVANYFPLQTDRAFLTRDYEEPRQDGTIRAPGYSKERVHSAKPILLRDANLVLEQSIRQHGKYVGLAIPLRNLNKIMNFTETGYQDSTMEALRSTYGNPGTNYLENLIKDLNGSRARADSWLSRLFSRYAGGVLGANLGVAAKQAASYPTAAAIIGWKPLIAALKPGADSKVDPELVARYTGALWHRSIGYSSDEGAIMRADSASQRGGLHAIQGSRAYNVIQGADVWTTTRLWKACENYVAESNPRAGEDGHLEKGTLQQQRDGDSPFYKRVAEVYNQVIWQTQPNYTDMERPETLRGGGDLDRVVTAFKTQPFQNYNILYDAISEYGQRQRELVQAAGAAKAPAEEALKEAGEKLIRAVTSQAVSSLVFALMQMAWDNAQGRGEKYAPADPAAGAPARALAMAKGLGLNMAGNLGGMLPFGSELFAWAQNAVDRYRKSTGKDPVFNATYFGLPDAAPLEMIDTMMDRILDALSEAGSTYSAVKDEERDVDGQQWVSLLLKLYKAGAAGAQLSGVPVLNNAENLRKDVWPIIRWSVIAAHGGNAHAADYQISSWMQEPDSAAYTLLFEAGGKQLYLDPDAAPKDYQTVRRLMLQDGFSAEAIDKAMRTKFRAGAPYRSARDQRQRELSRAASTLEGYADLTAREREKLGKAAQDAASYAAMGDLVPGYAEAAREGQLEDNWLTTMDSLTEDSGLRREELLLLRAGTSGVEGIKNAAGKTVAGSAGLRKMERAYSLLPGLIRLSEAQRRQVFGWLNVGGTVAGLSPAEVSAALKAIAP